MHRIFIDGEAGTTGLQLRELLDAVPGVQILSIDPKERKLVQARKALMAAADLVVLCLPNDSAIEAVALLDSIERERGRSPRVIDASSAHRTAAGWVFGFPELVADQSRAISMATRVSNPGCYSTGAIALIRPLVDAGLLPATYPLSISCVSGYTGGGRAMIAAHETETLPQFHVYGLGLQHKHLPEIMQYARLQCRPIFMPAVGRYRQGMVVQIPLHLDSLPSRPSGVDLQQALRAHYQASQFVKVLQPAVDGKVDASSANGSNRLELQVFSNEEHRQAVLVACLDNLGKGASGAAVQNIALMLKIENDSAKLDSGIRRQA